jgi:hypothetical protein
MPPNSAVAVLVKPRQTRVSRIVVPSVARSNFEAVRNYAGNSRIARPPGIHPMYTDSAAPEDLDVLLAVA